MSLRNDAKASQGAFEGIYHYRGSVNQMDYFIDTQEVYAIWYKPSTTGTDFYWLAGIVADIDSYTVGLYSYSSDPVMVLKCPNNEGHVWDWNYSTGSDWVPSSDISVKCVAENDFCTSDDPCGLHEGDCDINEECLNGFACGSNNCPVGLGYSSDTDCCQGVSEGDEHFCTTTNTCALNEGDCDASNECNIGLVCGMDNCNYDTFLGFSTLLDCCYNASIGDYQFCSSGIPCGINEGDCDSNNECQNGLACGNDNCNYDPSLGFPSDLDCCYHPTLGDPDWCTISSPCAVDEGGCSSNDECGTDLFCDSTNGCPASLGFASGVACCSDAEGSKCNFHQFAVFFQFLSANS